MFEVETNVARQLNQLSSKKPVCEIDYSVIMQAIEDTNKENGFEITEEQINAIFMALKNRVTIISGGPGRGKTTIIQIIAEAFLRSSVPYSKSNVIMLAPTGRAAQRITEATGFKAMTVHRAVLGDKIPSEKLVIVDETSMVDIFLMQKILKYAKKCNLIFVGDVYQIASVGAGKVLKDMIESKKIPYVILQKGHRNSGTIAQNAEMIRQGILRKNYIEDNHYVYTPSDSMHIKDIIVNDYLKKVQIYGIKDVLLCVAMRERGPISVKVLNTAIQSILTKGNKELNLSNCIYRVGDRVMHTKNNYNLTRTLDDGTSVKGVFNGERGTIIAVNNSISKESKFITVLYDDDSEVTYTSDVFDQLSLAYATTIHKCQGSEAACVLLGYTFGDYLLLNRSLFYTGVTRAKKEFRLYSEEKFQYGSVMSAVDMAIKNNKDIKRNTSLKDFITNPPKENNHSANKQLSFEF